MAPPPAPDPALLQDIVRVRLALEARPESEGLRRGLVALYLKSQRYEDALEAVGPLPAGRDAPVDAVLLRAWSLAGCGRVDEAMGACLGHPDRVRLLLDLAPLLAELLHWEGAAIAFRAVLDLRPEDPEATHGLALSLVRLDRVEEALDLLRAALDGTDPSRSDPVLVHTLAELSLLVGSFREGWALSAARFRLPDFRLPAPLGLRSWDGADPRGRRILVRWEQGYGDGFLAARYAALLAERGAEVWLESPAEAREVLATAPGLARVVGPGDALPTDLLEVPMMSLPGLLGTDSAAAIPWRGAYLHAPAVASASAVDELLSGLPPGPRVGLVWSGNPGFSGQHERRPPAERLAPLGELPGLRWISLQKHGEGRPGFPLLDLAPLLESFAETAHALAQLDLLVTTDTSVANLAGAMGRPGLVFLGRPPSWRWGLEGHRTPWYPTLELVRQPRPGDWDAAIEDLKSRLAARFPAG